MSSRSGLYETMPEVDYHAHPALSRSGMKDLLIAPALFKWNREHPTHKDIYDFGSLVHARLLGDGLCEVVEVAGEDWRPAAARQARIEARARGAIPALRRDIERADEIANAVRVHPLAGPIFARAGVPEASMFWTDEETGVDLKCRVDFLPEKTAGRRLVVPDLKTSADPHPDKWIKSAGDYAYHLQAVQIIEAVRAVGYADDAAVVFVNAGKDAPHLVSVIELTHEDLDLARRQRRHAIDKFRRCTERDEWPGIDPVVHHPSLPPFYTYPAEEALL